MALTVVFSAGGGLAGCGSGDAPPSAQWSVPVHTVRIEEQIPEERIRKSRELARSASLQCPFPEECEPAVALVSVVSAEGVDRCSGVLISGNRVLTNEHCLRGAIDLPCRETVFVHFAKAGALPEQHAACRAILRRSEADGPPTSGPALDYAVIELETPPSARRPLAPVSRGLKDREDLRIHRVQMEGESSGFGGSQSVLSCPVALGTYAYPDLASTDFELLTLGDCAVQAGNSGAAVVTSSGELGAILQGYLSLTEEESARPEFREKLLDPTFGQVAVVTKIDCIAEPGQASLSGCQRAPGLSARTPRDFLVRDRLARLPELPEVSDDFLWADQASEDPLAKIFVLQSKSGTSGNSCILRYRKGINRELRAEWRKIDESPILQGAFSPRSFSR